MNIQITGQSKEIADFVLKLQSQPNCDTKVEVTKIMNWFDEAICDICAANSSENSKRI